MSSWFSATEAPALADFWAIYDAQLDAADARLTQTDAPQDGHTADAHARIRRAFGGEWGGYEAHLSAQAAASARRGLGVGALPGLSAAFYEDLTPAVVRAYAPDAERLSGALAAMHRFGGRAAAARADGYARERDVMTREAALMAQGGRTRDELRYARLVESGILGVVIGAARRGAVDVNDAALAMVGYSRAELRSGALSWSDLTPVDWRDRDAAGSAELQRKGFVGVRETELLHKDGHRVPVLLASATIDGPDDEVISFILDATVWKRGVNATDHLRAIRAGEDLFRTLVEAVADYAIFMLDAAGNVVTWNRGAERLKGYPAAEIIGKHFTTFYTAEDLANGTPARELAAAVAGRSVTEGWRVRRDGSRFWADVVISAMKDPQGNVLGFAKVTRDLTARRAAEKALSDANQELEAFSYSVAHDLRAPLRGMSGFAQVLLDAYGEKLDAEGRDWLEEILLNAKKMGALIDVLLSLGRVTRAELRVEHVDLSALAGAILARLQAAEPERSVRASIAADLAAEMDPNLAQALLVNLIENAWKFSGRAASARIEVGATDTPDGRAFFVRDDGAGFDMAFAQKLFAPFQRLHTVREFPGTGVGLATAQRIVHRHGGRIWAEGAVGRGATFFFTLPVRAPGAAR